MLSLFPQLLDFQFYGPLILRLGASLVFLGWGWRKFSADNKDIFGWIELLGGLLLFAGLFTQGAALALIVEYSIIRFVKGNSGGRSLDILIYTILISLLVLGPGMYGFDLPL